MSNDGVSFNWARPTVHNGGANLTMLDGHVERVASKKFWALDTSGNMAHPYWYIGGSH
jgi:prepilin-type processing-associated H-X9-DG protein